MDLKLTAHTALVSGSTAGIGLAIATTLAQEGTTVIINGRTTERVSGAIAKRCCEAHQLYELQLNHCSTG